MPAYKYTLKNGKTMWYAAFNYTDWTGEKKHTCKRGFKTQREAKEYERAMLSRQDRDSDILFSALVENYLADMDNRLKPTTMEGKRNIIENKILPYFSRLKVSEIDSVRIRQWQNEMIGYRDKNGKPYAKTYLKTINNQMSAIMNYAVKHYGLPQNPCHAAGSMGKSKAKAMQFWTQEQYEVFHKTVKKSAYRLAFDILFYTGMRSGEMLALTPADILPSKVITINKNYAKLHGEEMQLETKTEKGCREVNIPDFLYDEIQEYINSLYGIQPTDRIFYFSKTGLEKEFAAITEIAGLPKIRVHDLRHSHASMLIEMGVDILEVRDRIGHESVQTTWNTYAHLYPGKDAEIAKKLNLFRNPDAADGDSGEVSAESADTTDTAD